MSATSPTIRGAVVLMLLVSFLITALPRPARACSCVGPLDLRTSIDDSEAGFGSR